MNKILSQALKKAVSEYSPEVKEVPKGNRPDLFSLNNETELFQNDKGIIIKIDRSRDVNLTDFGKATLKDRYLGHNESFQDLFARVASSYADDNLHAQRIYNYISNLWFMPATPVLSNGGTKRGLPISCFLNEASDSLGGILDLWSENVWLAAKGGGIGSYWGNLRSIGEKIGKVGKTSGIIPFIKVMDSLTMAISQGSLRRGSAACYLPVDHPEIEEFIEMRRPTGGDPNRKALNLHHGVLVSDSFMRAVENDEQWGLKSPADGTVQQTISARNLWIRLLTARIETGEPYIIYIDTVNRLIPQHHKLANLTVKTSNLCSEITLPTGIDKDGRDRTAVCCLSSLNLEKYDEWKDDPDMIGDVMRFLDNVLSDFINKAPDQFKDAKYSAERERSVGLGVMGFHSFLQKNRIKKKIKAVVACGNGTAGIFAPEILRGIGCEVIELDCKLDWTFPKYNPNPEDLKMLNAIAKAVKDNKADIGFGFDGDGDRVGVIDDEGNEIFSDKIGLLIARNLSKKHKNSKFIVDVKSTGLYSKDKVLLDNNCETIYWKTGHSHIKRKVNIEKALAGFEKSGHFFFNQPLGYGYDDGVNSAIHICHLLDNNNQMISKIINELPKTYQSPTMAPFCKDEEKYLVVDELVKQIEKIKNDKIKIDDQIITNILTVNGIRFSFEDSSWGLIRASSNKPSLVVVTESPTSDIRKKRIFDFIDNLLQKTGKIGEYDQKI